MKNQDAQDKKLTVFVPPRDFPWLRTVLRAVRFLAISLAIVSLVIGTSLAIAYARLKRTANELAKVKQWPTGNLPVSTIEYTLSTRWKWHDQLDLSGRGYLEDRVIFRGPEADLNALHAKGSVDILLVDADSFRIQAFALEIESSRKVFDSDGSTKSLLAEGSYYLNRKEYQNCNSIRIGATVR